MAGETSTPRARVTWLLDRWPTALAVATAALALTGEDVVEGTTQSLFILPLEYLIVAKLRSQRATWPVIAVLFPVTFVLLELDVPMSAVVSAVALAVLVWSVVDGHLRESGMFRVQALGMLGFGALGVVALVVDPDLGRYLVAVGWFLHGVWDLAHFKLDQVVARSYAEWCGVLDFIVAIALVLHV